MFPSMIRPGETFALRVKGESMIEDGILPGDVVVVRTQATARTGRRWWHWSTVRRRSRLIFQAR